MHVVVAPDSFKESLSAAEVARALAEGLARSLPGATFDLVPLADGGEGTLDALLAAGDGERRVCVVSGPLGTAVSAAYGVFDSGASIALEVAAAAGLAQVPPARRDPTATTSQGVGELIRAALDLDAQRLVVGLGGSATIDGGTGMLQALGMRFLGSDGLPLEGRMCGGRLAEIQGIDARDLDPRLGQLRIEAAYDVDNPLLGPRGASRVFGPQKGATPAQVAMLEAGLAHLHACARREAWPAVAERPGSGAAGGIGAALACFLSATLTPGAELVMGAVDLPGRLARATVVITGEGRLDAQTLSGKTPAGVARQAARAGVPVIAVGGALTDAGVVLDSALFDAVEAAVCHPCSAGEALADARANLVFAGRRIGLWLRLAQARTAAAQDAMAAGGI